MRQQAERTTDQPPSPPELRVGLIFSPHRQTLSHLVHAGKGVPTVPPTARSDLLADRGGSRVRTGLRAVWLKLRLMAAFGAIGPAAVRGGKLLARGRFREFARKLFNESADARLADAARQRTGPPLFLAGQLMRPGGYDHVVFAVLRGLTAAGVNVYRDFWGLFRKELIPSELRPGEARRRADQPRLAVVPPHLLARFRPDRRTTAFTMWESDTLPAAAVRALNRCGLVVVPSRWGAECFRANGVTVPVEVVPLGYDPGVFGPHPRRRDPEGSAGQAAQVWRPVPGEVTLSWGTGLQTCAAPLRVAAARVVFGTAGALDEGGLRKNVQRVIDLFRRAFPTERDVRLRVKVTPASPPVEPHGDPRIEVTRRTLSPAELADWYRSLSAFVNGSFGEGFGLHLLEAMACRVPLISTTFGGVGEFFDGSVGYEVGYTLVEARNAVYGGRWADPDDGEMIGRMRQVYDDPMEAFRLGERAARRAGAFTWDETARKLVEVLTRHQFLQ
jgi:glycosyltransferase involved in cell wall biosynthesis